MIQNSKSNLERGLIDIIGKDNLSDLIADYGEIGLDFLMDNELLKDIPIIGTIRRLFKLGSDIKDRIFIKKLYDFLSPLKNVTQKERRKFVNEVNKNSKKKQDVGLKLIMLIEKLDDFNKPQILSNLLIASMRGQITTDTFFKLSNAVSNTYIGDLNTFKIEEVLPEDVKERLYAHGLFSMTLSSAHTKNDSSTNLQSNKTLTVEVESETMKLYNVLSDSKISTKEIKDTITIGFDFQINTLGKLLKEFGLKNAEITAM